MFIAAEIMAKPLSIIFVGYDQGLLELTLHAFRIYSFVFLFAGFTIFSSSFFTALNNGLISAAISFIRTLIFQIAAVVIFPLIWGLDGIWMSTVAAEIMSVIVAVLFLTAEKRKYHY